MASVSQLQEVPLKKMILLIGPPGSGKSTFCQQTVLRSIDSKPIIYVTTEDDPSEVADSFRDKGLGKVLPHPLGFVDAFHETVGISSVSRPDSVSASSEDLTSLGIAISKMQERMEEEFLLIFDSLTSPYLMNGPETVRFMRLNLQKLAAEGNAVLACVDEGCGKPEDLVAMMSTADGIVKIELMNGSKVFNVKKHPKVEPVKIEVPMTWSPSLAYRYDLRVVLDNMELSLGLMTGPPLRTEIGDYVNAFWPNFARWCGMLWDPKRFPTMRYNASKYGESSLMPEFFKNLPLRMRFFFGFVPRNFSKVRDMKKLFTRLGPLSENDRSGIFEYLDNKSKTDEHYVRGYESAECSGVGNVGATLALGIPGSLAGVIEAIETYRGGPDREWNIIETKCIGRGDPYCESKAVPGEIDGLKESLESIDSNIIERVHGRLMDRLMGFLLHRKPLVGRQRLGDEISLHWFSHIIGSDAELANERYRMAMRLGGVMGGKKVGERLMEEGVGEDEAVRHVLNLMQYCKVGKVTMGDTIRIVDNCESFGMRSEDPFCFFTTGFLNGFFSAVKNEHIRELKCIAMGDPYCEWAVI